MWAVPHELLPLLLAPPTRHRRHDSPPTETFFAHQGPQTHVWHHLNGSHTVTLPASDRAELDSVFRTFGGTPAFEDHVGALALLDEANAPLKA